MTESILYILVFVFLFMFLCLPKSFVFLVCLHSVNFSLFERNRFVEQRRPTAPFQQPPSFGRPCLGQLFVFVFQFLITSVAVNVSLSGFLAVLGCLRQSHTLRNAR